MTRIKLKLNSNYKYDLRRNDRNTSSLLFKTQKFEITEQNRKQKEKVESFLIGFKV